MILHLLFSSLEDAVAYIKKWTQDLLWRIIKMCEIIQATYIDGWYKAFLFVYGIVALIIEQPLSWNSHMEIFSISHLGMRPAPLISLVWSWLFHFNVVFVKVFSGDCALASAFCVLLFSKQQQKREIHVINFLFSYI